jgi:mannose-1-phosphate guanylyltransferase
LIFGGERLIGTIGIGNVIVVDAGDAILVCPMNREQEVRDMVHRLEREELSDYL